MGIPKSEAYHTFKDFQILTEASKERMEYINGEIIYLASPNTRHQKIVTGISGMIWNFIRQFR